MDLRQYLRVIRQRWLLVALSLVVCVAAAAALTYRATPEYSARAQLFVSTRSSGADATTALQGAMFSQQRVKSYADIVASLPVVEAVKAELKLPDSAKSLQGEISASAPLDTVLINVSVTDANPRRARDIANSVSAQFAIVANNLETPQGAAVSPVKVSIVQPAQTPAYASSPNKKLNLALGLLLGLAIGVGGAILRDTLDSSVRDKDEAAALTGAPVLGGFVDDEKAAKSPLIVRGSAFSPRAEAFRQLRTNIRFIGVDRQLRSMVVTSSDASEGKTTVATNLAITLAQSGEQVILVDADLRRPRIGELLGLNPAVGLTSVLLETTDLDSALQTWRDDLDLRVLPSGPVPPNPSELLGSQHMRELLAALLQRATVVVFDTPPLLPVTDASVLSAMTDGALLVTRVGHTRREALAQSAEQLRRVGATVLGVALNRVSVRSSGSSSGYGYYGPTTADDAEASTVEAMPSVAVVPQQDPRRLPVTAVRR